MAVNPKGYVPALRLDDWSILTEGPAIVQYLADSKPASGLAPAAGAIDRYRLQNWLTFIGTELHKSFSPLFNRASSDDVQLAGRESTYHRNYRSRPRAQYRARHWGVLHSACCRSFHSACANCFDVRF